MQVYPRRRATWFGGCAEIAYARERRTRWMGRGRWMSGGSSGRPSARLLRRYASCHGSLRAPAVSRGERWQLSPQRASLVGAVYGHVPAPLLLLGGLGSTWPEYPCEWSCARRFSAMQFGSTGLL